MSLTQFIFIAVIVLVASLIQALFGFGFALIAVPLMIFVIDLPTAVVTATTVSFVSTSMQWYESRAIQVRAMSRRLILSALVGLPFGLWLLTNVDARLMKAFLGCMVLIGVFLSIKGFDLQRLPVSFDIAMGVLSGLLSTATSTNGPPLVFLLHSRKYAPHEFRAVLNRVFTISSFLSLLMFGFAGKITSDSVSLALIAIPVMGLGVFLGLNLREKVNPDHFRTLVVWLLLLSGLSAIVNAIFV